jgi:hypothetical protein
MPRACVPPPSSYGDINSLCPGAIASAAPCFRGIAVAAAIMVPLLMLAAGGIAVFAVTALVGSGADAALSKDFPWQFRLAAACRTPMLMYIVVPLSYVMRLRVAVRRWFRRMMRGTGGAAAAERHEAHVASIQEQIRDWNAAGRKRKLRTARPNFLSMSTKLGSNKGEAHQIKTVQMNEILSVDVVRGRLSPPSSPIPPLTSCALRRPRLSAGSAHPRRRAGRDDGRAHRRAAAPRARAAGDPVPAQRIASHPHRIASHPIPSHPIPFHPIPSHPISPPLIDASWPCPLQTHVEMESITIGGIAMGFGIETNSHKYGLFQESVLACARSAATTHPPQPAPRARADARKRAVGTRSAQAPAATGCARASPPPLRLIGS